MINKSYTASVLVSVLFVSGCGGGATNIKDVLTKNIQSSFATVKQATTAGKPRTDSRSRGSSSNSILEAAGYTKPASSGTSTTVSECIKRMPVTLMNRMQACMNKIQMQKDSYLSPYEASQLKRLQKMERDNVKKKNLPKLSQKKSATPQTQRKQTVNKPIAGVPPAMQGMMSNFIAGKSEFNDPELAQRMSDVYAKKSSNGPRGSSNSGSGGCKTSVYSTRVGGHYQQGRKTNC